MTYATTSDIQSRMTRTLSDVEIAVCNSLLDDAAIIIDTFNASASADAKKLVSCNMVIRAIGGDQSMPIGASQGTVSALGYSQSWTMPSGASVGELYLTRMDKRILGALGKIGQIFPFEVPEND